MWMYANKINTDLSIISGGADFVFIPERPPIGKWDDELCEAVHQVCIVL
jgi:hypothetical protein